MEFHQTLVHATGSRRLIQVFDTGAVETRICLRSVRFSHPDHPDMDVWHANILDPLEKGDLPAAHRALEFHNATVLADVRKRSDPR